MVFSLAPFLQLMVCTNFQGFCEYIEDLELLNLLIVKRNSYESFDSIIFFSNNGNEQDQKQKMSGF